MVDIILSEQIVYEDFSTIYERIEREQKRLERIEKLKRILEEDESEG